MAKPIYRIDRVAGEWQVSIRQDDAGMTYMPLCGGLSSALAAGLLVAELFVRTMVTLAERNDESKRMLDAMTAKGKPS